jgi:hypothetical protein
MPEPIRASEHGSFGQSGGRNDLDAVRQRRFGGSVGGHDHALHPPPRQRGDHRQQPRHRTEIPAERQLAQDRPSTRGLELLRADHYAERDRQIERGACLAQVGRGQVDGDTTWRVLVTAVSDRAPDPLPRLLQGRVREPDDREAGQPGRDVDLDANDAPVETVDGGRKQ